MENYKMAAEENMINLKKQEEEVNKKLLKLEWVIGLVSTLSFLLLISVAAFELTSIYWQIGLIVPGVIFMLVGVYFSLKIETEAGYYECGKCGHRYVPTFGAVFRAMHMGRTRYMKCPCCQKRSWQKKVLTK